ncbi:hypothetical protein Ngar_c06280 [Candidatus Nitrososphaera gargensis Ga9.2]|uniref:Uncharacterized protein n=1 Tax=Nitrososphaera gargensis (strain Ga9.2) TaxID=1237085 RepID=K0I8G9_NITGG|nr:hypothetical protein Ngar_c06280 [Candidatus Nitrososphaera gargensis Ga9.2]
MRFALLYSETVSSGQLLFKHLAAYLIVNTFQLIIYVTYEEEERKTTDKLQLKLLSKEKLQGTDIMTFRLARGPLDYAAGQYVRSSS